MAINKTINKRTNTHGAMRNCIEYVLREKRQNRQKQKFVAKGKGLSWKSVKPKKK